MVSNAASTAPQFLTDKDVAQRYSIGRATVWRWVKTIPEFPNPIKLAGCTRWRLEELLVWERQQ